MAVSVRMDPLMEKELELAAKRQGVTKSQFIIDAVGRALGRKDPAALYQQVMESPVAYNFNSETPRELEPPLRTRLQGKHDAEAADWLAFQRAKQRGEPWPPAGEEPAA
jgi:hypothetical protein